MYFLCNTLHAQQIPQPDSLAKQLKTTLIEKGNNQLKEIKGIVFDSLDHLKNILIKPLLNFKRPLVANDFSFSYSGTSHDDYFSQGLQYTNSLALTSNWSAAGIPLSLSVYSNQWTQFSMVPVTNFNAAFDRNNYLTLLKKQLKDKLNFDQYISKLEDPLALIKQSAEKALRSELDAVSAKYENLLKGTIKNIGSFDQLSNTDIKSLKQGLLENVNLGTLAEMENLFEQLHAKINKGEPVNAEQYTQLKTSLQQVKGIQEVALVLEKHKKNWESSGLINRMKQLNLLKKETMLQLVNDPNTIIKLAKQNLNLNSLQRIF